MSWVEMNGSGWKWVHGVVIPNYCLHRFIFSRNKRKFLSTVSVVVTFMLKSGTAIGILRESPQNFKILNPLCSK